MKRYAIAAIIAACSVMAGLVSAQGASRDASQAKNTTLALHAALDAQAPQWLAQYNIPAMAVAYIHDGKLAWTAVYGQQSAGIPATNDTLFNVASLTKPVVTETILRLAASGQINLDEQMAKYWVDPDIADNPWTKLLTPRIALRHRTGFPNWRYQNNGILAFKFKPDTRTSYSGEGFDYLARFAERKLHKTLPELVQQEVFDPAGMHHTAFTAKPWFKNHVAHVRLKNGKMSVDEPRTTPSAADKLYTTITDYGRFIEGAIAGHGLTPAIQRQRMTVKYNEVKEACPPGLIKPALCPIRAGFGLGWQVFDNGHDSVLLHTGKDPGVRTVALFIPRRKTGLVIFTTGAKGWYPISKVMALLYDNPQLNAQFAARAKVD